MQDGIGARTLKKTRQGERTSSTHSRKHRKKTIEVVDIKKRLSSLINVHTYTEFRCQQCRKEGQGCVNFTFRQARKTGSLWKIPTVLHRKNRPPELTVFQDSWRQCLPHIIIAALLHVGGCLICERLHRAIANDV